MTEASGQGNSLGGNYIGVAAFSRCSVLALLLAVEKGITNGVDATHFGPFAYCNRAQVVTFLYRAYVN